MKRVFILGAGASKFAGYPLGSELWPFIRDHSGGDVMANQRRQEVVDLIEHVIRTYLPPDQQDRPNLEELFTYLDLSVLGSNLLQLSKTNWKILREKTMGMIADAFQWHEYNLPKELSTNKELCAILQAWTAFLRPGDTMITFN